MRGLIFCVFAIMMLTPARGKMNMRFGLVPVVRGFTFYPLKINFSQVTDSFWFHKNLNDLLKRI